MVSLWSATTRRPKLHAWLWLIMQPLDGPVVPEVYIRMARSLGLACEWISVVLSARTESRPITLRWLATRGSSPRTIRVFRQGNSPSTMNTRSA
ncbi:hypothetical protein D3C80_1545740 [compost metagenome]